MDRDPEFEIQYLLSLIIAVLGSLGVEGISIFVPKPTAHLLLLLIFFHIVVFNIVYTLRRATEFELAEVNTLSKINRLTLYGITGLFCYLLVSVISVWFMSDLLPDIGVQGRINIGPITHRMIFRHGVPLLIVTGIGVTGWRRIMPSLRQARDIDVSIVPKEIAVFHEFDSTRPLHVNIENETSDKISFTTIIQFPEEVEWRHREVNQGTGTFTDKKTVEPEGHEPYNIELRYQGVERKTMEVDVIIVKDEDTFTDSVMLTLEEY